MSQGAIVLADDNKLVVKITSAILEGAGYSVSVAWDGLEAINKVYGEMPDLVILDIEMPKINGYQVCRLLKDDEFTKDIPVLMLTGRDQQTDLFWGMKTGADAYVTKGFKPEQLLSEVSEQMRKGKERRSLDKKGKAPGKVLDEEGVLSRVIDLLDSKLFSSTILNEIGALAGLSQDYRKTMASVLEIISWVVGNTIGVVLLFEEEEMVLHVSRNMNFDELKEVQKKAFETAASYGYDRLNPERVKVDIFGEENIAKEKEGEKRNFSFAHVPLSVQKRIIGILMLAGPASPAFARQAEMVLGIVQNQATIVIDNARLYEAARQLAITDGLTKLYNHRFFQELFEKEYKRSDRYNTIFSFIMLDIDHFKKVNDTYGHLCGDEILKGLADLIKGCLRSMDIVARYGGEEFAILLPETNGEEALQTAERMRMAVESQTFMGDDFGLNITVSMGVATYPSPDIRGRSDLIAKADKALYEAKESGRNRVVFVE
ncbi:MAG: diguanylate cyclase [Actinomycetota bacterium]|nr:diguanylate cyclase [Actinomycetota bacterium]